MKFAGSLFVFFAVLFLASTPLFSQEDYVNDNQLRYEDWSYKPNIQTIQLHESTFDANPAILQFNSGELLELSFDDLDAYKKNYSISFVHCNAEWQPSDLMLSEYMTGFYEANIINFDYATNTIQKYTHYK